VIKLNSLIKYKKIIKIIALSLIIIYVSYLIVIVNYSKEIILLRNNVNVSDIIFKYEADPYRHIIAENIDFAVIMGRPIFFIYKNETELGFLKMSLSNRRYLLDSKYVIEIETGKITIVQNDRISRLRILLHDYDKKPKDNNVILYSSYLYDYFIGGAIRGNRFHASMGIKHEYDTEMMKNAIYKFVEYFYDIFDGIYVYFFVSYEEPDFDGFDFRL